MKDLLISCKLGAGVGIKDNLIFRRMNPKQVIAFFNEQGLDCKIVFENLLGEESDHLGHYNETHTILSFSDGYGILITKEYTEFCGTAVVDLHFAHKIICVATVGDNLMRFHLNTKEDAEAIAAVML